MGFGYCWALLGAVCLVRGELALLLELLGRAACGGIGSSLQSLGPLLVSVAGVELLLSRECLHLFDDVGRGWGDEAVAVDRQASAVLALSGEDVAVGVVGAAEVLRDGPGWCCGSLFRFDAVDDVGRGDGP